MEWGRGIVNLTTVWRIGGFFFFFREEEFDEEK